MASPPDVPKRFSWAWDEEPVSTHQAGLAGKVRFAGAHFFLAAVALGFSAIGFFVPAREGPVVGTAVGAAGVACAIGLAAWGVVIANKLVTLVDLYPSGLLWLQDGDWAGGRWEEVTEVIRAEVYLNGAVQTKHVGVTTAGGDKAQLHHALSHWAKMADTILMQTTLRKVPPALAAFERGESLRFGDVAISRDGLAFAGKHMSFAEIGKVEVANGNVIFYPAGGKGCEAVSFATTPNYMVFLKLLDVSPAPRPKFRK